MTHPRIAIACFTVCAAALAAWGASCWREYSSLAARKHYDCVRPDPVLLLRSIPGCQGELTSLDGSRFAFRTNREGAYNAEVSSRRPGVPRILVLGDSLLIPFTPGQTVLGRIEEMLLPKRVEFINGAQPGYSLPQVRLWARELVRAYQPDAVLLVHEYFSMGLGTGYHHLVGARHGPDGLVEQLGYLDWFWPLPSTLTRNFPNYPPLRFLATSLRATQESLLLRFGPRHAGWFTPGHSSPWSLFEITNRYLDAIADESRRAGAVFHVARLNAGCSVRNRLFESQYKSELRAATSWLGRGPFLEACRLARSELRSARAVEETWIDSPRSDRSTGIYQTNDIHLTETGIRWLSTRLEPAVRRVLERVDSETGAGRHQISTRH